jgi:hypothetical protein
MVFAIASVLAKEHATAGSSRAYVLSFGSRLETSVRRRKTGIRLTPRARSLIALYERPARDHRRARVARDGRGVANRKKVRARRRIHPANFFENFFDAGNHEFSARRRRRNAATPGGARNRYVLFSAAGRVYHGEHGVTERKANQKWRRVPRDRATESEVAPREYERARARNGRGGGE